MEERRAALPQRFISWADRRHLVSVRSAVLGVTIWMTWEITKWAFQFAYAPEIDPIGKAAIIAAVTAPFAALQGAVFSSYMSVKRGTEGGAR